MSQSVCVNEVGLAGGYMCMLECVCAPGLIKYSNYSRYRLSTSRAQVLIYLWGTQIHQVLTCQVHILTNKHHTFGHHRTLSSSLSESYCLLSNTCLRGTPSQQHWMSSTDAVDIIIVRYLTVTSARMECVCECHFQYVRWSQSLDTGQMHQGIVTTHL